MGVPLGKTYERVIVAVLVVFGASNLAMALPFGAWWPFVPLMVTAIATPLLNVSVSAVFTALVAVFTDLRTPQPSS